MKWRAEALRCGMSAASAALLALAAATTGCAVLQDATAPAPPAAPVPAAAPAAFLLVTPQELDQKSRTLGVVIEIAAPQPLKALRH